MGSYGVGALSQSLETLVGQLFVVALDPERSGFEAIRSHRESHYGGVFLNRTHLQEPVRTRRLTYRFRRSIGDMPPPIVCIDEEGGLVTNIGHLTAPAPSAQALGIVDDEDVTHDVYVGIGEKLRALGFNSVFAPVLDVNVESANPVIGTRAFGASPERVEKHALAALRGLRAAGIASCVKHFPGHGATTLDSHATLPTVSADRKTLNERELAPFRKVLEGDLQPEMVMTAHVAYPALDRSGTPATVSENIVQGVLRRELGYRGVVITDSMEMKGIAERYGPERAAVEALQAGVDLLLYALDREMAAAAYLGVVAAARSGKISEERLTHSVDRAFRMRTNFRSLRWHTDEEAEELLEVANDPVFFQASLDSLVVEGNAGALGAIAKATGPKVIVLPRQGDPHRPLALSVVREQLEPAGFKLVEVGFAPTSEEIARAEREAADAAVVVVGVASRGKMTAENRKLVDALTKRDVIKVGVALLDPTDADLMMGANCRIKTFGYAVPQLWAMCQRLLG